MGEVIQFRPRPRRDQKEAQEAVIEAYRLIERANRLMDEAEAMAVAAGPQRPVTPRPKGAA